MNTTTFSPPNMIPLPTSQSPYRALRPSPRNRLSLVRLHLLKVQSSTQRWDLCSPDRDHVFKHMNPWGNISHPNQNTVQATEAGGRSKQGTEAWNTAKDTPKSLRYGSGGCCGDPRSRLCPKIAFPSGNELQIRKDILATVWFCLSEPFVDQRERRMNCHLPYRRHNTKL